MNTKLSATELLNETKKNSEPIKNVSGLPIHVNKTRKKGVKYSTLKIWLFEKYLLSKLITLKIKKRKPKITTIQCVLVVLFVKKFTINPIKNCIGLS